MILSAASTADAKDISELYLSNMNINEITQYISLCKNLKKLNLNDNKIPFIEHLHKLGELLEINLSFNLLWSIDGLWCPKLWILKLDSNKIESLDGIDNLKCLVTLTLSHNKITSMKQIPYLAELKELDLSGNQISKIEMMSNLPVIEDLNLSSNLITKINANELAPAKSLLYLNLAGNQIKVFKELE